MIVGIVIAIITISVALLITYCADNKGYVSDEEWKRSRQEDEEVRK